MSSFRLPDILFPRQSDGIGGVVVGLVTNNQDPEGQGRVRVKYPWLGPDDESFWARIAVPMAGNGRGTWFLPEIDDEVLIAFEQGSIDHPYIIGALWNGKDHPPESNADGGNNLRTIKSRSGHVIRLDDTAGAEKVEIIDKTGSNRIMIDSSQNSITLEARGNIRFAATGKIEISGNSVEIESQAGVSVKANADLDLNANGQVNVRGNLINLN